MSRPVTVVLAVAALVVAGLLLLVEVAQSTVHYALPTSTGVTSNTYVFGPGVAAAVLAGLVVLLSALWLVLAVVGRSTSWMLITVGGLLVLDVVVLIVVSSLSRPTF